MRSGGVAFSGAVLPVHREQRGSPADAGLLVGFVNSVGCVDLVDFQAIEL
jgi:uncharacterized protein (UPF0261 family)